jgi:TolA-binding protein
MDDFLGRFGESERAADVRWLRASLLIDRGECATASGDLRALAIGVTPRAADGLFALASCARAAGAIVEARAQLEEYLRRFPEGPRRADAERALRGAEESR